jgi:Holliday junction DNA helicase RuvB
MVGCEVTELKGNPALRPRSFAEFVGQRQVIDSLRIAIDAARRSGRALDHTLLSGPSGVGKSSIAHLVAGALGAQVHITSAPSIEHRGELASLLTALDHGDVLFVDEIHRLSPALQECLYPALEDRRFDMFTKGHTRTIRLRLPQFCLVGATTRPALLTAPLRDRFGLHVSLGHYTPSDMTAIIRRSGQLLEIGIDDSAAAEIGRRSRGTPRVANRLLRRVRDYAESCGAKTINMEIAVRALEQLGLDSKGLDARDRAYLGTICDTFGSGPVGIESIAVALGEERATLECTIEPFLVACGFVARTPRGRVATAAGIAHSHNAAMSSHRAVPLHDAHPS